MKNQLVSSLRIMFAFFRRDMYTHWHHRYEYLLDTLFLPCLYALVFGYLQPYVLLGSQSERLGTALFVGSTSLDIFWTAFGFSLPFLYDREYTKFIDYQITLLHPALLILQRLLSGSFLTFLLMTPYFLLCKLVLGHYFDTSTASWPAVYLMLYVGSIFCTAYNMMTLSLIKDSRQLGNLWMRFHNPLTLLGGFWIPLAAMHQYSAVLGYISLLNPMIYITEGLRCAFMGGKEYLSVTTCVFALLGCSLVCYGVTCIVFKKKIDHI